MKDLKTAAKTVKEKNVRICRFVWLSRDSEASLQPSGLLLTNGRQALVIQL